MTQTSRGNRRGLNFTVRVTEEERLALDAERLRLGGPPALGPWLKWRALDGESPTRAALLWDQPARGQCQDLAVPVLERVILDLCAGSGSWSEPYLAAGYKVVRVTLPENDVRTFVPPSGVWGVLAAPPCTEFSLAKNGQPRDLAAAMDVVSACMRVVLQARPKWWALENPTGLLGHFLGRPRDVFQPFEYGDPWTKRTALWGEFAIPKRGPFVEPTGSAMDRATAAERAVTPPGFARAFFEANP